MHNSIYVTVVDISNVSPLQLDKNWFNAYRKVFNARKGFSLLLILLG